MLYPPDYFINPYDKIKVVLIGCGGTGSRLLVELSALSQNLVEMGHLGFQIHVFDNDKVEQHNIGRQCFYQSDVDQYKSNVLASRINRSYGDDIRSYPRKYSERFHDTIEPDVIISAVDNVKTRKQISKFSFKENFIWLDTGNDKDSGQVILSMYKDNKKITPNCVDLFPNMVDEPEVPSCSTREALFKQSFMINKFIGSFAIQILSSIFIDYQIPYSQLYFNMNPLKIKTKL